MDRKSKQTDRERQSRLSATLSEIGIYDGITSPQQETALAPGEPLRLMSKEALGLAIQYSAIGLYFRSIDNVAYPFFDSYLQVNPTRTQMYVVIVGFGWYFKAFFGIFSDCMPIFGYRRKSYMLIGWVITFVCMLIMACMPFGKPYCSNPELCYVPIDELTEEEKEEFFDFSAPTRGLAHIVMTMVLSFGYIMTVCASDALVVQYARREPIDIRGRTQCAVYAIREIVGCISFVLTSLCLYGPSYQGTYSFEIKPNVVYGLLCVPSGLAIVNTFFWIQEYRTDPMPIRVYFQGLWELLQKRVTWQLCIFIAINGFCGSFSSSASLSVYWKEPTPVNYAIFGLLGFVVWAAALVCCARWGLLWNWRWSLAISTILWIALSALSTFLVVWDHVRDRSVYRSLQLVSYIPSAARFIISFFCAVEIADMGNEGAIYGLTTSIYNMMSPFSWIWNAWINSNFDVSYKTLKKDTSEIRWNVTSTYLIAFAAQLISLVVLFLLPSQKREMQDLKRYGGSHPKVAIVVYFILTGCLLTSLTSNILSIYPSTQCMRIAAGPGC